MITATVSRIPNMQAANDSCTKLISATVTINLRGDIYTFPAIGTSVEAISASAEELAGDDPFGVSVMVQQ